MRSMSRKLRSSSSSSSAAWLRQSGGQGIRSASPHLADLAQHHRYRLRRAQSALDAAENEGSSCWGALPWCGRHRKGVAAAQAWEGARGMMEDAAGVIEVTGQERR